MADQKNLILAIVLSVLIVVGFQFVLPTPTPTPEPTATEQTGVAAPPTAPGAVAPGEVAPAAPAVAASRDAALAAAPRLTIETPRLVGSLSLVGAKLDDLTLLDYRETTDPQSKRVVLLSPPGSPVDLSNPTLGEPYWADFGWTAADPAVALPGADTVWAADAEALTVDRPVTLSWDNGQGLVFERTIAVDANYMFTVTQRVRNTGAAAVSLAPYGRIVRDGTPWTLGFFILHEGPYGVFDDTLEEYSYSGIEDDGEVKHSSATGGWLGFTDKYWLVALAPDQKSSFDGLFRHDQAGQLDRYSAIYQSAGLVELPPGTTTEVITHLFAGAKEVDVVDAYEENPGIAQFDLTIDFGWFYFLTKPFFYVLAFIHGLVGNFGIAILCFTVLVKLAFFPLANKSYKSMSRMKALQPQMMEIRERFKDDRQRMNQEMMQLYRREKVNPAAGCLPIIVQIPVFFALYKVLFVTIEMRHAPFFGWIQDLSAPDPLTIFNLFGLIPFDPPSFLMIGPWPLIMGLTMWLQQKLNPAPADPLQQKIFMALPIIFTFMLSSFPAGLVIYWAWNNLLSIGQQWLIMKRMGVKFGGGLVTPPPSTPLPPKTEPKPTPKAPKPAKAAAPAPKAAPAPAKAAARPAQATRSSGPRRRPAGRNPGRRP